MDGNPVDDFIEPLIKLGLKPKGDVVTIAMTLAEDAPGATAYQLRRAMQSIRTTWRYQTFPPIAVCLEAIRSAPVSEYAPPPAPRTVVEPSGVPPFVAMATRYLDEYEAADPARRAVMDRLYPQRYATAQAVIRAFG